MNFLALLLFELYDSLNISWFTVNFRNDYICVLAYNIEALELQNWGIAATAHATSDSV